MNVQKSDEFTCIMFHCVKIVVELISLLSTWVFCEGIWSCSAHSSDNRFCCWIIYLHTATSASLYVRLSVVQVDAGCRLKSRPLLRRTVWCLRCWAHCVDTWSQATLRLV